MAATRTRVGDGWQPVIQYASTRTPGKVYGVFVAPGALAIAAKLPAAGAAAFLAEGQVACTCPGWNIPRKATNGGGYRPQECRHVDLWLSRDRLAPMTVATQVHASEVRRRIHEAGHDVDRLFSTRQLAVLEAVFESVLARRATSTPPKSTAPAAIPGLRMILLED